MTGAGRQVPTRPLGRESRRERARAMRRADIVSAALEVFGEQGYDAATMDEIARRAEYTKRTLYAYFPSKLDLLLELIARSLALELAE